MWAIRFSFLKLLSFKVSKGIQMLASNRPQEQQQHVVIIHSTLEMWAIRFPSFHLLTFLCFESYTNLIFLHMKISKIHYFGKWG